MPETQMRSVLRQQLDETVRIIREKSELKPKVGLVIGSGLGGLTAALKQAVTLDYSALPHVPQSTAPGHAGKLILGTLEEQPVAILSGRFHFYEGYTPEQIVYPIRLLHALGTEVVILTSIVGSMNPAIPPGSIAVLEDHINLMGMNPLIGPNDDTLGSRFPDMSEPYDVPLRQLAQKVAEEQGLALPGVVYVAVAGPNLETRAEYRFLRQIGADIVGMSTVPEVIGARHLGMRVLAFAVVSDACIPEELKPASIEELLRIAAETEPSLTGLVRDVIKDLKEVSVHG